MLNNSYFVLVDIPYENKVSILYMNCIQGVRCCCKLAKRKHAAFRGIETHIASIRDLQLYQGDLPGAEQKAWVNG